MPGRDGRHRAVIIQRLMRAGLMSMLILPSTTGAGTAARPDGRVSPAPATPAGVDDGTELGLPPEVPDDPPGKPATPVPGAGKAAEVRFGRFTHIQVNVDAHGANIPGDAANEPSIAVDPTHHDRMAIGWRQFNTISSNFREAGSGYSNDGGRTWTSGRIDPGVFRSDPVLASDAQGAFFYSSLNSDLGFVVSFFESFDHGGSWSAPVFAYGGDKQWFTIDRGSSIGHDFIYQSWSSTLNPTPPNTFNRSTTGGQSFAGPTSIPQSPIWGTLDVASDGAVYVSGTAGPGKSIYVARSSNAKDPGASPVFITQTVDLGGAIRVGGPNPAGLLGQVWVAADRSASHRAGWVYALASVATAGDPMDVHFVRSTDGGQTWSAPVRINDDPSSDAWQWFGTMSVSPDGRIDAVWNDTRGTADSWVSALYYSYSTDGGFTWSGNEQVSPVWDSRLGWPNQEKIGDYYQMVSDSTGADLAWAATFNGEEDVYYVRITPPAASASGDPGHPVLHPVIPNPFGSSATMAFDLPPGGGPTKLSVVDATGRRIATLVDGSLDGGRHLARWNGTDEAGRAVASGIYLCRLEASGHTETRRMILLR